MPPTFLHTILHVALQRARKEKAFLAHSSRLALRAAVAEFKRPWKPDDRRAFGVATFNTRTMSMRSPDAMANGDDENIIALIEFCKTHHVDVLCVQEHRWRLDEPTLVMRCGWHMHFGSATKMGQGGVAILLSPRVASEAVIAVASHRLMTATFPATRNTTTVIAAYAPTALHEDEQRQFHAQLSSLIKATPGTVFVGGDFNAVLFDSDAEGSATALSEARSSAHISMLEFMEEHDLVSAATTVADLPKTWRHSHNEFVPDATLDFFFFFLAA
jgi:exonuclease III